jgi:hypothetical protein
MPFPFHPSRATRLPCLMAASAFSKSTTLPLFNDVCAANESAYQGGFVKTDLTACDGASACGDDCSCISTASCTGICGSGGTLYNGLCIYLAPLNTSCSDFCADHDNMAVENMADRDCTAMNELTSCTACTGIDNAVYPAVNVSTNICYYPDGNTDYSLAPSLESNLKRLCPCKN